MLIFANTQKLQVLLGAAGAIPWVASYVTITTSSHTLSGEASATGATNGATPVDVVADPGAGAVRQLKYAHFANDSGGAITLTVRYNDNGTSRDRAWALDAGDLLQYSVDHGWTVLDSAGKLKVTTAAGGGGSLTVEEVDGAPSFGSITTLRFDQADGFVVSQPGAGIARVDFTGGGSTNTRRVAWMLGG